MKNQLRRDQLSMVIGQTLLVRQTIQDSAVWMNASDPRGSADSMWTILATMNRTGWGLGVEICQIGQPNHKPNLWKLLLGYTMLNCDDLFFQIGQLFEFYDLAPHSKGCVVANN